MEIILVDTSVFTITECVCVCVKDENIPVNVQVCIKCTNKRLRSEMTSWLFLTMHAYVYQHIRVCK